METMKPARATHRDQTMAKNFIQPGRVVTLVAPTGGVLSGQAVQVGALFGIAAIGTTTQNTVIYFNDDNTNTVDALSM